MLTLALAIAATLFPVVVYTVVGLRRGSRATTVEDYFIYSQSVSARDYANTSVGYALQMAALFLFADWGIRYGLGALWTPLFWMLGFLLLYKFLPRFSAFHDQPSTLHGFLYSTFEQARTLQVIAAIATILGLWGTMMSEIDYTVQLYAPVIPSQFWQYSMLAAFLAFGSTYIILNGYKAEVLTERVQVPIAYCSLGQCQDFCVNARSFLGLQAIRFHEPNLAPDPIPAGAARRMLLWPERRGAGKGAPVFGAAKRTLVGEHRSGIHPAISTGGVAGIGSRSHSCW